MIKTDALIIGAGPTGLFTAHQLKLIGLSCEIVDNLDKIGGQCIELYPDKPIYDIPAVPECTGEELTNKLLEQIKPFKTAFYFNERVNEITQDKENWIVQTSKNNKFIETSIRPDYKWVKQCLEYILYIDFYYFRPISYETRGLWNYGRLHS